ncbi:MAG: hypothetical protein QNJ54_02740 [Prochloraceae cyanobacterium]|nr:hypothetical protein [Prochloraceae cyanobacterium]
MTHKNSPLNCTSAEFEKAAIARFCSLITSIPRNCKVFREPWGCSTVLCVDCAACPELLGKIREQAHLLLISAQDLGLANSVIFKIGNQVKGWSNIKNYS